MSDDTNEYICETCGGRFPKAYKVHNQGVTTFGTGKVFGTGQLMRLHALSNFRKHTKACKARQDGAE